MKIIFSELSWALRNLFSKRKHKLLLLGLVLLAAGISVAELGVAKAFTTIALTEDKMDEKTLIRLVIAFFIFFALTRIGQYGQRIYRLRVFEKYLKVPSANVTRAKENSSWNLALELSNLLGTFTQLLVISTLFLFFSPLFVGLSLIVFLLVLTVLGRLYKKQLEHQRKFVALARKKEHETSAITVKTRIQLGEFGGLISGFGMMILMGGLLYLSYFGDISSADTVILFLGLRMQSGNLTEISKSLMRFARARAQSE